MAAPRRIVWRVDTGKMETNYKALAMIQAEKMWPQVIAVEMKMERGEASKISSSKNKGGFTINLWKRGRGKSYR